MHCNKICKHAMLKLLMKMKNSVDPAIGNIKLGLSNLTSP